MTRRYIRLTQEVPTSDSGDVVVTIEMRNEECLQKRYFFTVVPSFITYDPNYPWAGVVAACREDSSSISDIEVCDR